MGKSNKPKTNRKPGIQDVMQTPPHALEPLYPYLPKDWIYWESACGPDRLIINTMRANGYQRIVGSDILEGEQYNYFTYNPTFKYDLEITNVPFSDKYLWLARAFERGKRFAFIVPYETTFAADFKRLFRRYNNNPYRFEKLSPERRINYKTPNYGWGKRVWDEKKKKYVMRGDSAQMPTCWIVWGLDVYKTRDDGMTTFFIDMRSVKYDDNNQPIVKEKRKHVT